MWIWNAVTSHHFVWGDLCHWVSLSVQTDLFRGTRILFDHGGCPPADANALGNCEPSSTKPQEQLSLRKPNSTTISNSVTMKLSSPAFANGAPIPAVYSRGGDNVSPPLEWTDVPEGTRSLALIVDDPDAPDPAKPKLTWVHWVLYNIPPQSPAGGLSQGSSSTVGTAAANDWKQMQYDGPAPPIGVHRYFFKLYALDTTIDSTAVSDKPSLLSAMKGHVLASAELVGTFTKQQKGKKQ